MIATHQAGAALNVLKTLQTLLLSAANMVRGDAHAALQQWPQARQAYHAALAELSINAPTQIRTLIAMKTSGLTAVKVESKYENNCYWQNVNDGGRHACLSSCHLFSVKIIPYRHSLSSFSTKRITAATMDTPHTW